MRLHYIEYATVIFGEKFMPTETQMDLPGFESPAEKNVDLAKNDVLPSYEPYVPSSQIDLHFSNFIARNAPPRIYPGI